MYTTIRKNSLTKIRAILSKAILITGHVYDDMTGGEKSRTTIDQVMDKADRFDRVYLDDAGRLHIHLCGSNYFDAYPTVEAARKSLTPDAFAKYFPAEGQADLERTLDTNIERAQARLANAIDDIAAAREVRQLEHLRVARGLARPDALGQIAANDD